MKITPKEDGKHQVQLTRDGEEFLPGRELGTAADIDWAKRKQKASIIVEVVMLVMQVVGIAVIVSIETMKAKIEDTVEAIKKSAALQSAINKFISSWKEAGRQGNVMSKAEAILNLLVDIQSAGGYLLTIIKSLCEEMPWLDWVKTVAMATALIIAGLETDVIVFAVVEKAVHFKQKVDNVVKLEEIEQTRWKST
ncbi:hypothetical protein OS493_020077 [Desmophyllum pertusum]|uniref:Uncharacterized protein n=1 Tax=Desmophyllum pertusum TaxID=174260 RepID=A0A9X0CGC9_9CNID|nr:hypothetical protein OS493_020077 [Desmophyllum pertusum]